jgi:hypothetical protein
MTETAAEQAVAFLKTLRIPEGPKAGEPLRLAPFQSQFVAGALAPENDIAVLSVGRGNAKSALSAGVALGALLGEWDSQPRRDIIIAGRTRDVEPQTETYLLFPYRVDANGARLISAADMAAHYPLAWEYLRSWEQQLRGRENDGFNDGTWWRFGRHQNVDKQEIEKLIVPRLVTTVSCSVDARGQFYLDNVDVGGVAPARGVSSSYLAGILNCPVAGFVFRQISKPFRGDFRSANRQFIAPLPVPDAPEPDRAAITTRAERLQALHTRRRDLLADIARRMQNVRARPRPEDWLFPDLPSIAQLEAEAPARLDAQERRSLARHRRDEAVTARLEALGAELRPGVTLDARFERGELRFYIDGAPAIERVFMDAEEGAFVLAQWKVLATNFSVTEATTGKKLANALRKVALTAPEAVRRQIIELQAELGLIETEIAETEAAMNAHVFRLYNLAAEEIAFIERG